MVIKKECKTKFKNLETENTAQTTAIQKIATNDLPHINAEIVKVNTNMDWVKKGMIGLIALLGAIFVALIVSII